jgi:pimeloyl-ACP methyl ester carboxylesterase
LHQDIETKGSNTMLGRLLGTWRQPTMLAKISVGMGVALFALAALAAAPYFIRSRVDEPFPAAGVVSPAVSDGMGVAEAMATPLPADAIASDGAMTGDDVMAEPTSGATMTNDEAVTVPPPGEAMATPDNTMAAADDAMAEDAMAASTTDDAMAEDAMAASTTDDAMAEDAVAASTADDATTTSDDAGAATDDTMAEAAATGPVALSQGTFTRVDALHAAEGTATIYQVPGGAHVLRLENFDSTNGPDLYIGLSGHPVPRSNDELYQAGYTELGRLKAPEGSQNYDLPADLDLSQFKSVVIYCRAFSVVFSTAELVVQPAS